MGSRAMPEHLIAVTGATGAVGTRVATRVADRGARQRLVVRDPTRAPKLPGAEVRAASGYGDAEGMRAALEGAHPSRSRAGTST
jgi:NAD(P)H dehydrogenase (quinone)